MAELSFELNGHPHMVQADDNDVLLDVLRHNCQLKATRFGCGLSQCGACHVMVDDHAVPACSTPMWAVAGKRVVTVEGLGTPEQPHALQTAFADLQAAQCGYCSSGMLMTAAGLLRVTPQPTPDQVRAALQGNLCRCGAHNRIVRAVCQAADAMAAA
jgi:nicotinate dehydrogenase subunit A